MTPCQMGPSPHFSQTVVQGYHVFVQETLEGAQAFLSTDDSQGTDD